ncbi:fasciclin-like arabinogalactan protein 17 [Selaginella moellendorffii]|nr:fasciclin-like arabinogalactan protein 17 [Selaginella moellendorffii]|eukprot:XP_002964493.2 fasciclin-like arabinogalactan protein 17 [Selaginella moellendorffii]
MRTIHLHLLCAVAAILAIHNARSIGAAASVDHPPAPSSGAGNVALKSVLAALLESPATEMMELVEQAGMLEALELAADRHNLTIFAPRDEFLELHFDADFRRFLLLPGNVRFLQELVMFHVLPIRITASQWRSGRFQSLSGSRDEVLLHWNKKQRLAVDRSTVDWPDMIVRSDGVVHRIDGLLVPKSVQDAYAAARISSSAVLPQAAPSLSGESFGNKAEAKLFHVTFPVIDDLIGSAPAPAPSPSRFSADGHGRVQDFIAALVSIGGYGEIADLLVNLTSLSVEIANLVNEGHALTVLAPGDRAVARLAAEHLGAIESILAYHIVAEYQTEESLYTLAKRHDRVVLSTLHEPPFNRLVAREIDGTVEFGSGNDLASSNSSRSSTGLLMDPNIYTDGRISVQGINAVLIPPRGRDASNEESSPPTPSPRAGFKDNKPPRKLFQMFFRGI